MSHFDEEEGRPMGHEISIQALGGGLLPGASALIMTDPAMQCLIGKAMRHASTLRVHCLSLQDLRCSDVNDSMPAMLGHSGGNAVHPLGQL